VGLSVTTTQILFRGPRVRREWDMKSLLIGLCLLGLLIVRGHAAETSISEPANASSLTADGELQNIREPLSQIFKIVIDGSKLKIDRAAWDRIAHLPPKNDGGANAVNLMPNGLQGAAAAQQAALMAQQAAIRNRMMMQQDHFGPDSSIEVLFQHIEDHVGRASSHGRSGSGNKISREFGSETISGRLQINDDDIHLTLEEMQGPQRLFQFKTEGENDFRIQLIHPEGDLIIINQKGDGRFSLVSIMDGKAWSEQADSFLDFFRQHRKEMDGTILPILERFGICPILAADSPELRNAVLSLAIRTPDSLAEGKQLLYDLDNGNFDKRERASRLLNRKYDVYCDLINQQLAGETVTTEGKHRLQQIVDGHPESQRVNSAVNALKLLEDPKYLASLLDDTDAAESAALIQHLETLTGQKLGVEPAAWKDWAAKNQK
jgi:hypothetical protein